MNKKIIDYFWDDYIIHRKKLGLGKLKYLDKKHFAKYLKDFIKKGV